MKAVWSILAGIVLVSCGFTGDAGRMGADVLVVNNMADVSTLDPGLQSAAEDQRLSLALFEGLCVPHPETLAPLPGMAASWSVSEDGLVWTFRLREAQWSDGEPVTAHDFLYAWRRVLTPPGRHRHQGQDYYISSPYVDILYVIRGARQWHQGDSRDFSTVGMEALGDRSLRVTLERPTPWFLELLSFPTFAPVPRHVVENHGQDWTRSGNLVCNGPFRLADRRPGTWTRVEKNPLYWDLSAVGLGGIVYLATDQIDTAIDQYLAGESDWVRSFNPKKVRAWRTDDALSKNLRAPEFLATFFFRLNVRHRAFRDPRIRQALSLAVDRDAITRYVTGLGEDPATGLVPTFIEGVLPWPGIGSAGLAYDPERARRLIRDAGHPGGRGLPPLTIAFNTDVKNRAIAEAVQQMWSRELGVDVVLENREKRVHFARERAGDYIISRGNWIGDYSDPATFLDVFRSDGSSNRTGWSNAEYDRLLDEAAGEQEPRRRFELLGRAERIVCAEDPAIIPVFFYRTAYLLRPERFEGIYENSRNIHPPKFIRVKQP